MVSVTESISLVVKSNSVGQLVPNFIEILSLVLSHVSVQVFLTLFVAKPLFHYFPSLAIQHALMGHLLKSCARVFVHLVSFGDLLAVRTYSALGVSLESLLYLFPVLAHFSGVAILHDLKPISGAPFYISYTIVRFSHHFLDVSKTLSTVEKRIILIKFAQVEIHI